MYSLLAALWFAGTGLVVARGGGNSGSWGGRDEMVSRIPQLPP
jgi:hypothetical protein